MAQAETLIAPRAERARTTAHLRVWLLTVAALVFVMVSVGGATRLTGSGLSITEWQPIMGALPPLSEADWHEAFAKYRQIPQYHHVNKGMSLEAFKLIFWWEWTHRFLGRLIGFVFLVAIPRFPRRRAAAARPRRQSSPASSCSAGCRDSSAGTWCGRAWPTGSRQPVPARPASGACHPDLRRAALGGAVAREPRDEPSVGAGSRSQRAGRGRGRSWASCSCRSCSARSSRG